MGLIRGGRHIIVPDMGLRVRAPRSAAAAPAGWWVVSGEVVVVDYEETGTVANGVTIQLDYVDGIGA